MNPAVLRYVSLAIQIIALAALSLRDSLPGQSGVIAGIVGTTAAFILAHLSPSVSLAVNAAAVRAAGGVVKLAALGLLALLVVAACSAAQVRADEADAIDLTNAACDVGPTIASAIDPVAGPVVTVICQILDDTGRIVGYTAATVPAAKAAAIVAHHPHRHAAARDAGSRS